MPAVSAASYFVQARACLALLSLTFAATFTFADTAATAPQPPPSAWTVDYSRWTDGQRYATAEARADWPTLDWFEEPGDGFIRVTPASATSPARHWLEPRFKAGTHTLGAHGTKFAAHLAPRDAYTLAYEVRFPEAFEFSQGNTHPYGGGKLPGLSGGNHPSGGLGKPGGMSARPMWRRDERFTPGTPTNYLELYLYWQAQTEKYGDRFFVQAVEAGRSYRLKITVALGTPARDGSVRVWVDDQLRLERSFRFLHEGEAWQLSQYMHNVFYGGNDPTWAPARDGFLLLGPVRVDERPF